MKISIITVCRNSESTIKETINSVLNQSIQDQIEYIIIDGASTDKTINIIEEYQKIYPINLISEPDNGIYDAMNKGVKVAKGEWIIFLNSDDYLYDQDVIKNLMIKLDSSTTDIIYGSTEFRYKNFQQIRHPRLLKTIWKKMPFNHQSCLVKRQLLINHPFDTKYRLAADYKLIVYCYTSGANFDKTNTIISSFSGNGSSNKLQVLAIKEYKKILKEFNLYNIKTRIFYSLLTLKPWVKKITPLKIKKIIYKYFVK